MRGSLNAHGIASVFLLVNIDPVVGGCAGGDVGEGAAGRRSRSFSRRRREISAAGSKTEWGADAGALGRNAGPECRPPRRQLRSIDGAMPSSPAICVSGRPLLTSSATASRLKSSVN